MKKAKVLIVDDSPTFLSILKKALERIPEVEVIGTAKNGQEALNFLESNQVDLISLDLEMPGMNGFDFIKNYLPSEKHSKVVIVSSVSEKGIKKTIESLQEGAFEYIIKPTTNSLEESLSILIKEFQNIFSKLEATHQKIEVEIPIKNKKAPPSTAPRKIVKAIGIGISTGGPLALKKLLSQLSDLKSPPIFIVQHILAEFVEALAQSLNKICPLEVKVAKEGEKPIPGHIYLAPGNIHMTVEMKPSTKEKHIKLLDAPPEQFCKPSINPLFRSMAKTYAGDSLAILMTGMGRDGSDGLSDLKKAGAHTIAQDEESSVIFGIPQEAIQRGLIDQVLNIDEIANAIKHRSSLISHEKN